MTNASIRDLEVISACNLCQSRDIEDVYASTAVRRCRACGYTFRSPRPSERAIASFYSREGKYTHWLEELESREFCWRHRVAVLRRFVKAGHLLDVGAGIGEFLVHARPFFDVTGTEISDEAIRLAHDRFGVSLLRGTLAGLNLISSSFDAISLIHVLEHVMDPADTIQRCRELLRPGGHLLIAVPNDSPTGWYKLKRGSRRTLRRIMKPNAPEIAYSETPPFASVDVRVADRIAEIHLSHFAPDCLRDFLSRSGFDPLYMAPERSYTTTGWERLRDDLDRHSWGLYHSLFGRFCYQSVCLVSRLRP